MKGIYLASYKANHPDHNIVYQDINGKRDIAGDMLEVDLTQYDYIIATPPCNYWSRANYRRETSEYSKKTKHLLPCIIHKLSLLNKPFIVENVRNDSFFEKAGLYDYNLYVYKYHRHTYWSNIKFNIENAIQEYEYPHSMSPKSRQGGVNVHNVIEEFIKEIENDKQEQKEINSDLSK